MTDIVTFRLSARANDVAAKLVDAKKFDSALSAAKFALAYTIKNHFDTFDPKSYSVSDSAGNTYNVGSFDAQIVQAIYALYPGVDTPMIYIRSLVNYGLERIGDIIDQEGFPKVSALCE